MICKNHHNCCSICTLQPSGLDWSIRLAMTTLANRTILVLTALITASVAQLVVDRANQDLKAVPKDIDPDVTILKLSKNSITQIEDDDMAGLLRLEKLNIEFNEVRFISAKAFLNNTQLAELLLSYNPLRNLTLGYLPSLKKLYAQRCNLKIFPDLSGTLNLEVAQLHGNDFTHISQYAVSGLIKLRKLAFSHGDVRYLPDLSHLMSLEKLVIADNALTSLPDLYHLPLTKVPWNANPVVCNTSLCWVRMWSFMKPGISDLENVICAAPPEVTDLSLMGVHPVYMKCFDGEYSAMKYRVQDGPIPFDDLSIHDLNSHKLEFTKLVFHVTCCNLLSLIVCPQIALFLGYHCFPKLWIVVLRKEYSNLNVINKTIHNNFNYGIFESQTYTV